jgi:hypothetical protein
MEAEKAGVPYPVLHHTAVGVGVQYEASAGGVTHHDQYLKAMAEAGVHASTKITLTDGTTATIGDLVRNSLHYFDIEQELEFTAVAYSRWLPPSREWINRYGESHSFDEVAWALLSKRPEDAACRGTHVAYALVNLLRADEVYRILKPASHRQIEDYLIWISSLLEKHQTGTGLWLGCWYASQAPMQDSDLTHQAILVTGHHLEWMALAPSRLRPPDAVIQKAARSLATLVENSPPATVAGSYPPYSHAGRALALLVAQDPLTLIRPEESTGAAQRHGRGADCEH